MVYNYFCVKKILTVETTLCFGIGLYFSITKNRIDKIIMKNDIIYFGFLSITILLYFHFYKLKSLI